MISFNNKYILKDGKPWFPVMGEYEFSRSDSRYWRDGIEKMKALGCDVIQSYVIWIHHEEIEGKFNFRGNNNLRKFIREIKDAGMMMCLRIGPWVHGEVRNGGFPDWIYEKGFKWRTSEKGYMDVVERYFKQLYEQCKGFMYSDGGPIFSIQVENEYNISEWGGYDGNEHMRDLVKLLKKIGFDVPIYFATGWGEVATGDCLPCYGSYCEAPWENHTRPLPPSTSYLMKCNPTAAPIGEYEDRPIEGDDFSIVEQKTPFLTIELGGGVQMTQVRRPISKGEDNGALTMCKLGQGVTNLGYYVFHGGINPVGALSTTQEYHSDEYSRTRGWGFACDLNELNYDFQAPVSQYGKIKQTGDELKLWMTMSREFENELCPADIIIPADSAVIANDFDSVRYSIRKNGDTGFLFVNNYVRLHDMTQKCKSVVINTSKGVVNFDNIKIGKNEYFAYPFNLEVGSGIIKKATATPYFKLNNKDIVMWAYNTDEAEIDADMKDGKVILLSKDIAKKSYKIKTENSEHIVIADGEVFIRNGCYSLATTSNNTTVKIYPQVDKIKGFTRVEDDGIFAVFTKKNVGKSKAKSKLIKRTKAYSEYEINVTYEPNCENTYLELDFSGNSADIFVDGEKVNDRFFNGVAFEVGLKHHNFPPTLNLRVYPLKKDDFVYIEKQPVWNKSGVAQSLDKVDVLSERVFRLKF